MDTVRGLSALGVVAYAAALGGCSSSLDRLDGHTGRLVLRGGPVPESAYRTDGVPAVLPELGGSAEAYVRYALMNNPGVEAAYQSWRAAAERVTQAGALPDPRLTVGAYLEEVQTRTGPQEASLGVQQSFPWPGTLGARESVAGERAMAAWWRFEAVRQDVSERVWAALHELAYLDHATAITRDNLELIESFEDVVRARYRVGTGQHTELIRAQVELGETEDRLAQLVAMRPSYEAALAAAVNLPAGTPLGPVPELGEDVVTASAEELAAIARSANPQLRALDRETAARREATGLAKKDGLPGFTLGLNYIVTGSGSNTADPNNGDDPVLLTLGISLPIDRVKYDAHVREAVAQRLSSALAHDDQANRVSAAVVRAWFEHTDAARRVGLYERTLIPKAEESMRSALAGFRAGDSSFLDVLDTERTLLGFALAGERARADRGIALARLERLVGRSLRGRDRAGDAPSMTQEGDAP